MAISKESVVEQLKTIEEESRDEEARLWGGVQGGFNSEDDVTNSPAFREIVQVLRDNPLLVAPTLQWVRRKRAEMAAAQLHVLYSPEELEQMKESLSGDDQS